MSIWFLVFAFTIGVNFGFVLAAIMAAGSDADDQAEEYEQIKGGEL